MAVPPWNGGDGQHPLDLGPKLIDVSDKIAFVYHMVPNDLRGNVIYPLNQLVAIHADLYEQQKAKYINREASMDFRIPGIDVLWNSTVHCAPLHPYFIRRAREKVGIVPLSPLPLMAFKIPLDRILVHPVVWYWCRTFWINGAPNENVPLTPPLDEFEPFDAARYKELADVTAGYVPYLGRMKERGERPLTFPQIPHVLVAGPIDISGLSIVRWDAPPGSAAADLTVPHRGLR